MAGPRGAYDCRCEQSKVLDQVEPHVPSNLSGFKLRLVHFLHSFGIGWGEALILGRKAKATLGSHGGCGSGLALLMLLRRPYETKLYRPLEIPKTSLLCPPQQTVEEVWGSGGDKQGSLRKPPLLCAGCMSWCAKQTLSCHSL